MFDIPPRIRLVLAVAAAGGLLFIAMGSLAAGSSEQIHLDKLVHGIGYTMLGLLVILALPPIWYSTDQRIAGGDLAELSSFPGNRTRLVFRLARLLAVSSSGLFTATP